ncbi:MAG: hypothetical protein KJ927_10005, partial [Candidatus Eisenbacteria bacterium]|nr:hypothetical protein [Candidatus Eisenbacteria bacterium]
PSLDIGQNFFPFEVTAEECQPIVTMRENRLGRHVFPSEGETWNVEVPSNTDLRFTWTGDAAFCGSLPGNVNYGLDLEDPGDENDNAPNGIGGWIGWGLWEEVQTPFSFPDRDDGKTHNFYLKMMDQSNNPRSERFCWVAIKVVAFPMNKTALIVDDATPRPYMFGTDPVHDAFRDRVLRSVYQFLEPGEEPGIFNMFRTNEGGFNPESMPLELVAAYKMIIWNTFFFGTSSSGLNDNEFERHILTSYIGAGGRLYLYGSSPIGCLAGDNFNYGGDGLCPDVPGADEPAWDDESFIWTFLHLTNCVTGTSGTGQQIDGWVGSKSVHPLYPDLDLNTSVWNPWRPRVGDGLPVGGTVWFEVYKNSRSIAIQPEPGMDTLYVLKTFNYQGVQSRLEGYPITLRYQSTPEDSALGIDQGRVFLQMFPFFPCHEGPATEAATKAITWVMTGRDE